LSKREAEPGNEIIVCNSHGQRDSFTVVGYSKHTVCCEEMDWSS